eukprot:scaffold16600_cov145-Skeletonema_dohrnii-CCMP3373.AAC.9
MLSYLKAKTLADRRKLVPVIATVLCLTPEEQAQAVNSVEDSAGLSGVAVSFWENLATALLSYLTLSAVIHSAPRSYMEWKWNQSSHGFGNRKLFRSVTQLGLPVLSGQTINYSVCLHLVS